MSIHKTRLGLVPTLTNHYLGDPSGISVNLTELLFPQPPGQYKMFTIKPAVSDWYRESHMRKSVCETAVEKNTKLLNFLEKNSAVWDVDYITYRAIADTVKWQEKKQKLSFLLMRIIVRYFSIFIHSRTI